MPRPPAQIASTLRLLIHHAGSRQAAWPHFKTAMGVLNGFSAANAPLGTDELQWFLAGAWNKGVRRRAPRSLGKHAPTRTRTRP